MKKLLSILLLLPILLQAQTLVEQRIVVPTNSDGSSKDSALLLLPIGYGSTTRTYPGIIYLHGTGSGRNPLSNLYNSGDGGIPTQLEHGGWDGTAVNLKTSLRDSFIVLSPQDNTGWAPSAQQLLYIKAWLLSHYRVDTACLTLTGLSAGGVGIVNYVTGYNMSPGPSGPLPSGELPLSYAQDYMATATDGQTFVSDSIPVWGFGDTANDNGGDIHGIATNELVKAINGVKPGYARFHQYLGGHCCWGNFYVSTYTENFTWNGVTGNMNIYQWMLLNRRSSSGTTTLIANAGGGQTITLPTSSVTLNGSGSTGTITSYAWTKVSGPNTPTLGTPSAVTCSASGLIQGNYVFQLSVNGGVSTSTVAITVNAATGGGGCSHAKYTLSENADSAIWEISGSFAHNYLPGDTIVIPHNPNSANYWAWVTFVGLNGSSACPIVISNDNVAQTLIKGQVQFDGCTYIKFTGNGQSGQPYGFKLEYDPVLRYQTKGGVLIFDRSKNIEIAHTYIHNVGTGIGILTDNNCDTTKDYPNWTLDSMVIDSNKIVGIWNEGMYLGNTSPDNNVYDARLNQCTPDTATQYNIPMKSGYSHIYGNLVDSTGRGGIQVSNTNGSTVPSEINNNVCTHNGMNQDDAQGTSISVGLYFIGYIHDNTCVNTYTWGIASLGGGATNVPVRIENNHIDSCGYLKGWNRIATTGDDVFNPGTEPQTSDTLTWPYPFEIKTVPKNYTQASGGVYNPGPGAHYGTGVRGQDSTQYWVKNNTIGRYKGGQPGGSQPVAIQIHDYHNTIQKNGNAVCGNTSSIGQTITASATDSLGNPLTFSTSCTLGPTVSAGSNQTVTSPATSAPLNGTATGNSGATIVSTTWTKFSGGAATITSAGSLNTSVTGLSAGTYIFQLIAIDSNGLSGSATVTITVQASAPAKCINSNCAILPANIKF